MSIDLSDDIRVAAMAAPQKNCETIRVVSGGRSYPLVGYWKTGFSMRAEIAAGLRGLVEIHDGDRYLGSGLVVAQSVEDGIRRFAFKRFSAPLRTAPVDFVLGDEPTAALLPAPEGRAPRPI